MTSRNETELQLACFRLGMDQYALDIMRIKEIIRPQKLSGLPKAPSFIDGMLNLRGMVIPVVDMRKRFDLPDICVTPTTRLLIVKVAGQMLGLVVDDVTEVVTVSVKDIKPPPMLTEGPDADSLIGVCLVKDEMVLLLNPDKILSSQETYALKTIVGDD